MARSLAIEEDRDDDDPHQDGQETNHDPNGRGFGGFFLDRSGIYRIKRFALERKVIAGIVETRIVYVGKKVHSNSGE